MILLKKNYSQIFNQTFFLNLSYIFNISFPMLLFAFFYLSDKNKESLDYVVSLSLCFFFSFSFSGNYRQTLIADNDLNKCKNILYKRIFFCPIIILMSIIISFYFLKIQNIFLIIIASLVAIIVWINEINLCLIEIENKLKNIFIYLFFNLFFFFLLFISFFYLNSFFLYFLILIYLCFYLIIFFKFKTIKELKLPNIKLFSIKLNYLSSASINFSAFLFKYQINYFFNESIASFIVFCITAGSCFATIIFNSLGPRDFNNSLKLSNQFLLMLFIYLVLTVASYCLINFEIIFTNINKDFKNTFVISIVGGLIFTYSYILRQNLISKMKIRSKVFLVDIFYSFLVINIIPLIYFWNSKLIIYCYLATSLTGMICYLALFKKEKKYYNVYR